MYCRIMECNVEIINGDCTLQIGSLLGLSSCPNKHSLVCPLVADSSKHSKETSVLTQQTRSDKK